MRDLPMKLRAVTCEAYGSLPLSYSILGMLKRGGWVGEEAKQRMLTAGYFEVVLGSEHYLYPEALTQHR